MRNRFYSPDSYNKPIQPATKAIRSQKNTPLILRHTASTNLLPTQPQQSVINKIGTYIYDFNSQIGKGYSSIVYKGTNIRTNKQCAVKVVDLKDISQSSLKMVENQIKIIRSLDHPNIIKCLDVYRTSRHCYIITQYCCQGDLLGYLAKYGKIQQVIAVDIMTQIIEGVKYLLSKGIIHRDLKPANILKANKTWKIADFGFSILGHSRIISKNNVGTPLYMPLEALVDNIYSPSSDIFSVGIIFYEILTGITPWECSKQKQLIQRLKNIPFQLPQHILISANLLKILKRICSVYPENRMTKEEFINLNLICQTINPEQKSNQQRRQDTISQQLLLTRTNEKNGEQDSIQAGINHKTFTRNNHILISQLHYCRFMYYFIRNIRFLKVGAKQRSKLTLLLFNHMRKLAFRLSDCNNNYFHLKNWESFKLSPKYIATQATIKQYFGRYEKQYFNHIKGVDEKLLQLINRDFRSLISHETFTLNGYGEILNFVSTLLRQSNHNITIQTVQVSQPLGVDIKAGIEALKSLYKYYKLVLLSKDQFQSYEAFEKKSNIKIQIDYTSALNITIQQYCELREELKCI